MTLKCYVPNCTEEWIYLTKYKSYYCDKHLKEMNKLYDQYKNVSNIALEKLDDMTLDEAILLRQKFIDCYTNGNINNHTYFINLLKILRNTEYIFRQRIRDKLLSEFNNGNAKKFHKYQIL